MKIYLPHLNYTVYVRRFKKPPKEAPNALAYTKSDDMYSSTIFVSKKMRLQDIAHELVHVLQFICVDKSMDFIQEQEHMAYIMGFLFKKIQAIIDGK